MIPPIISLPSNSTIVEDVDEEIFLLYTRKLQTTPTSETSSSTASSKNSCSLGFLESKSEVLPISLIVSGIDRSGSSGGDKLSKGKKKEIQGTVREIKFEMEVWQDLDGLRNRKGDTGSVIWRISLYLAQFLLQQHHFPSPTSPSLLPTLSKSTILELGSGTGFIGTLLTTMMEKKSNWIFTDQLINLPLVLKNLRKNEEFINQFRKPDKKSGSTKKSVGKESLNSIIDESEEYSVKELDWLEESVDYLKSGSKYLSTPLLESEQPPDLILALDCIYNPSLSLPLFHTISRYASYKTVVLVASELRDEEPLEVFLTAWLELDRDITGGGGWEVWRVGFEEEEEIGGKDFVVWAGWRKV